MKPYLVGGLVGALIASLVGLGALFTTGTLEVSTDGDEPEQVTVPDAVGNSPEDARAEIEALGLTVRVVNEPTGDLFRDGRDGPAVIVGQTPQAEASVPPDATVTLEVGD